MPNRPHTKNDCDEGCHACYPCYRATGETVCNWNCPHTATEHADDLEEWAARQILPRPRSRHEVYGALVVARIEWSLFVDLATEWVQWQIPGPIIVHPGGVLSSRPRALPPELRAALDACKERLYTLEMEYRRSVIPS